MKKVILFSAAMSAAAVSSYAQSLVAGWDFSQFQFDGSADTTGDFVGNPSIDSNFGVNASTLYWDGSFSTTAIDFGGAFAFAPADVFGSNGAQQSGNLTTPGLGGDFSGSGFGLRFGTGAEGEEFVFALDTTTFGDISLTFDAQTNNGSSDLQFAYSTNGGASYTNFGSAVTVGSSSALQTVDMSAVDAIEGLAQALIKVSISGLSGAETLSLDNVQVLSAGAAVPEPSSFAAIFGGLALAFAAARRRN